MKKLSNHQILEKAIQKAIEGGWNFANLNAKDNFSAYPAKNQLSAIVYAIQTAPTTNDIIFNHDFAKALWGEADEVTVPELPYIGGTFTHVLGFNQWEAEKAYLWHLQQMVIADDPIQYLADNI